MHGYYFVVAASTAGKGGNSFVGKIFVLKDSTTKTTNIFPPPPRRKLPDKYSMKITRYMQYMLHIIPLSVTLHFLSAPVLPLMTFKASDEFIQHGDTFDLTCILSGFPSNFSRITSKQTGNQLSHHVHKRLSDTTTRSYVPVFHPEGNVYVCEAESYFDGKLVAQFKEEVTVHVYSECMFVCVCVYNISVHLNEIWFNRK